MTLEEAILRLENMVNSDEDDFGKENKEALKLGIEALKALSEAPAEGYTCVPRPLPGETEK